ncbi:hypothetical protein fugu_009873 [Takifugu bimaculatus]|uniref:Uncharacterized protein n=1 Tax=Takifugu bimaculatus TaxID=433685 RepID=A0A4Z2CDV0_9TELE|nr:hypothetical protein fugu_009873 [Takifugu bimaculatus]
MSGYNTGAHQSSRHHRHHGPSSRAEKYRQTRSASKESTASQDLYRDPHREQEQHADHYRRPENKHGRSRSHPRNGAGRGSETIGFIPGSADSTPANRPACGSCASMGWSGCKALICCVLTCGFYGSREPCLPVNESSTDQPTKAGGDPHPPNGLALTNPTCGVPLEGEQVCQTLQVAHQRQLPLPRCAHRRADGQVPGFGPQADPNPRERGQPAAREQHQPFVV